MPPFLLRGPRRGHAIIAAVIFLAILLIAVLLAISFLRYVFRGGLIVRLAWLGLFVWIAAECGAFQR